MDLQWLESMKAKYSFHSLGVVNILERSSNTNWHSRISWRKDPTLSNPPLTARPGLRCTNSLLNPFTVPTPPILHPFDNFHEMILPATVYLPFLAVLLVLLASVGVLLALSAFLPLYLLKE
jgi:hypothetical protein